MRLNELKDLLNEFGENIKFECDLKKKIGLIQEVNQRYFIGQIT